MSTKENQPPAVVQRGDSKYTWQDTIALIGQDFAASEIHIADDATDHSAVSRYCEVWEISNPIYRASLSPYHPQLWGYSPTWRSSSLSRCAWEILLR